MAAWLAVGRHVGLASLAGLISGVVVGGLLGRVAMRVSGFVAGPSMAGLRTSNGNRVGDVTLEGTLALIFFAGVFTGLAGGLVFAVLEPWLRRLRPWHGLAYGAALLVTFGFTVLDPFNFDFNRFGPLALNVAMFSALFIIFGLVTAWSFDQLASLAARTGTSGRAVRIAAWVALGLAAVTVGWVAVGSEERDRMFLLASVGALMLAAIVRWRGLPRPIGYAGLAALLLFGAMRTFDGLQQFRWF